MSAGSKPPLPFLYLSFAVVVVVFKTADVSVMILKKKYTGYVNTPASPPPSMPGNAELIECIYITFYNLLFLLNQRSFSFC